MKKLWTVEIMFRDYPFKNYAIFYRENPTVYNSDANSTRRLMETVNDLVMTKRGVILATENGWQFEKSEPLKV